MSSGCRQGRDDHQTCPNCNRTTIVPGRLKRCGRNHGKRKNCENWDSQPQETPPKRTFDVLCDRCVKRAREPEEARESGEARRARKEAGEGEDNRMPRGKHRRLSEEASEGEQDRNSREQRRRASGETTEGEQDRRAKDRLRKREAAARQRELDERAEEVTRMRRDARMEAERRRARGDRTADLRYLPTPRDERHQHGYGYHPYGGQQ